jgi:hypothetical protein
LLSISRYSFIAWRWRCRCSSVSTGDFKICAVSGAGGRTGNSSLLKVSRCIYLRAPRPLT